MSEETVRRRTQRGGRPVDGPGPDHRGDGDGWVECDGGHRHWGRFGAAGLLAHRPRADGSAEILLQHRAEWSHHGGTWGLPGGACDRGETSVTTALREAAEEAGVARDMVRPRATYVDDHGGWSYATVVASASAEIEGRPTGGESIDVRWVGADEVEAMSLHPGFAGTWQQLREALDPLRLVVDVANVMGSRPDGWWRDRAGAASRIVADLDTLASTGVRGADLPDGFPTALSHVWPDVCAVVEGAARAVRVDDDSSVEVARATGSGDDAIVDVCATAIGGRVLVVTADRELRSRCQAHGATTVGPRWLLDLFKPI